MTFLLESKFYRKNRMIKKVSGRQINRNFQTEGEKHRK